MKLPRFEEEVISEIEAIMKRRPERGVVACMCCERYFSSADRRRIHFCPGCKNHVPSPAFGCPTLLLQEGGVSLCRMKSDPSHTSNDHLFNGPRYKDRRRRHEDLPEEEELEELIGEDLGIRVCTDRDND